MKLYHGSSVEVNKPKILFSEKGRDFGIAFYLTPIKEQAERMAKRKQRFNKSEKAIVSVFEWDETIKNKLNYKLFDQPNLEWLEMIIQCRSNPLFKHPFDIVEGKIADDSVGETVLFVMDGIISKEDAIKRLKFQKINSQIAFCTYSSLESLSFLESYEVK